MTLRGPNPGRTIMNLAFGLALIFSPSAAFAAPQPILNVYLVQNSGWMEPFYTDKNAKFKPLIAGVVERTSPPNGEVVLAAFNQRIKDNPSPALAYRGKDRALMLAALETIVPAKKPGSTAFADTDFKEAVTSSINQYSPGRPCILWIFTNNKNSPDNDPKTAAKNKEFYSWLRNEENIRRIMAYPLSMPVKGRHYQANGLMIYAMAHGEPADRVLYKIAEARLPFGERAARLKPLDSEAVTFIPTAAGGQDNVTAAMGKDGNTLVLQFKSSGKPEIATINGHFINDFFPYDIRTAKVSLTVKFKGGDHGIRSLLSPDTIESVAPGNQTRPVTVKIGIPPLPSIWKNPGIIFKSGYQEPAVMEFALARQELHLSADFLNKLNALFPDDPLPAIFLPDRSANRSLTLKPLLIDVAYPAWPLILLGGPALAFLVGGLWLLAATTRKKKFTISVDGTQKTYHLKAFGQATLYSETGESMGSIRRGLGKPALHLDENRDEQVRLL